MKSKDYFITHSDCVMTAAFFENKEIYERMGCGVIHGEGCNKEKCYEQYERIVKADMVEVEDEE